MIALTRLTGAPMALNADLIERVEQTPDTVITLIDGKKFLVTETLTEVVDAVRVYHALIAATAAAIGPTLDACAPTGTVPGGTPAPAHPQHLQLVTPPAHPSRGTKET